MTVEALCNQLVTLQRHAGVAVKAGASHGESEPTYTSTTALMYLEASGPAGRAPGKEDRSNRNTPTSEWFAVGLIGTDFSTWDQIVFEDRTFEIVSPPQKIWNPRTRVYSHWEMFLRQVDQPL